MPDLLGYRQLRRASGGITPSLDLLEVAAEREVPALLHEYEQARTMFDRTADVVVWVNDIMSLRKEMATGGTTNGVLVFAEERGIGLQQAIDEVYRLVATQIEQFEQAEGELEVLMSRWTGLEPEAADAMRAFAGGMLLSTDPSFVRPGAAPPEASMRASR